MVVVVGVKKGKDRPDTLVILGRVGSKEKLENVPKKLQFDAKAVSLSNILLPFPLDKRKTSIFSSQFARQFNKSNERQ